MNRSANGNDKFLALSPVSSIQNITNFNTTSLLLSTIIKEEDMHLCNRHSTLLDKLTNSQLEKMPRTHKINFLHLQSTLIDSQRENHGFSEFECQKTTKDLKFSYFKRQQINSQIQKHNSTDIYSLAYYRISKQTRQFNLKNKSNAKLKTSNKLTRLKQIHKLKSKVKMSSLEDLEIVIDQTTPVKINKLKKDTSNKSNSNKLFKLNARNLFKFFTKSKSKQALTSSSSSSTSSSSSCEELHDQIQSKLRSNNSSRASTTKFSQIQIKLEGDESKGYGFTVVGYCPCQIGKVERDSISEYCGLLQGDLIIKINGKNVSRATCDSIAKIIKNSQQPLVLDIMRSVKSTSNSTCGAKPQNYAVNSTENDLALVSNEYNHLSHETQSVRRTRHTANKRTTKKAYNSRKQRTSAHRQQATTNKNFDYSISINNTMPSPIPHMSPLLVKENQMSIKKSSIADSDYKTQSSTTDNDAATISSSLSNIPHSEANADEHLNLCEKLLNLEEKFIDLMQKGVQQYSRPLRHCMMINTIQHYTLFQNIEKILAISEYQLNQLINQDDSILLDMFNTIGKLYENKMRMSCEAFDIYQSGIENSFDLLYSLSSNPNLAKFLYESQEDIDMDLKTFLLLPIYYVGEIHECLRQIKERTSNKTNDYLFLSALCSSLEAYVSKSSVILNRYNQGQLKNPLRNSLNTPTQSQTQSSLNLVYSSSIQYRQSCHKWKKVKLLFFEDRLILLSYNSNVDKFLSILKSSTSGASVLDSLNEFTFKTILFSDIVNLDFDLDQQFEFNLTYSRSKQSNSFKTHTIKLKSYNLDEKLKWSKLFSNYLY